MKNPYLEKKFNLKPHAKFEDPMITPSGRKVTSAERRREKCR
jgi:hypothetical protein